VRNSFGTSKQASANENREKPFTGQLEVLVLAAPAGGGGERPLARLPRDAGSHNQQRTQAPKVHTVVKQSKNHAPPHILKFAVAPHTDYFIVVCASPLPSHSNRCFKSVK
jgi:hypothetical protein